MVGYSCEVVRFTFGRCEKYEKEKLGSDFHPKCEAYDTVKQHTNRQAHRRLNFKVVYDGESNNIRRTTTRLIRTPTFVSYLRRVRKSSWLGCSRFLGASAHAQSEAYNVFGFLGHTKRGRVFSRPDSPGSSPPLAQNLTHNATCFLLKQFNSPCLSSITTSSGGGGGGDGHPKPRRSGVRHHSINMAPNAPLPDNLQKWSRKCNTTTAAPAATALPAAAHTSAGQDGGLIRAVRRPIDPSIPSYAIPLT